MKISIIRINGARKFFVDPGTDRIGIGINFIPGKFGVVLLVIWPKGWNT
jgi:hypothetical protein